MHAAGDYARLVTAIRRAIISPTCVFIGRVSFPRIDGRRIWPGYWQVGPCYTRIYIRRRREKNANRSPGARDGYSFQSIVLIRFSISLFLSLSLFFLLFFLFSSQSRMQSFTRAVDSPWRITEFFLPLHSYRFFKTGIDYWKGWGEIIVVL